MSNPNVRQCELTGCQVTFRLTPEAPHKRFCCYEHRQLWHTQQRQAALQAWKQAQQAEGAKS